MAKGSNGAAAAAAAAAASSQAKKARAGSAGGSHGSAIPVLGVVVAVLAVAAVYLNSDLLASSGLEGAASGGAGSSKRGAETEGSTRSGAGGEGEECKSEHRAANVHFRAGRIQHGLEELMKCAKKHPESARCTTTHQHPQTHLVHLISSLILLHYRCIGSSVCLCGNIKQPGAV